VQQSDDHVVRLKELGPVISYSEKPLRYVAKVEFETPEKTT
jgi:hypothetical protein